MLSISRVVLNAYLLVSTFNLILPVQSNICDLVFPKYGDQYVVNEIAVSMYVLISCHFTGESLQLLHSNRDLVLLTSEVIDYDDQNNRYHSVVGSVQTYKHIAHSQEGIMIESFKLNFNWGPGYFVRFAFKVYTCTRTADGDCVELASMSTIVVKSDKVLGVENTTSKAMPQFIPANGITDDTETPSRIDFIEIGTSGFDTLLDRSLSHHSGLSIEPLESFQSALSDKPNVRKLNFAVGPNDGFLDMFYIPKSTLDFLGYSITDTTSNHLYGLSRIGINWV
jgi:hypothetical protein